MKNGNGKRKEPPSPPWSRDGRPDLWVRVGDFAKIMKRTTACIYNWLDDGTLKDFGYSYYRDIQGFFYIKIPEQDRIGLDKMKQRQRHLERLYSEGMENQAHLNRTSNIVKFNKSRQNAKAIS